MTLLDGRERSIRKSAVPANLNLHQVAGYGSGLLKKHGEWLHRVAVANLPEEYDERQTAHRFRSWPPVIRAKVFWTTLRRSHSQKRKQADTEWQKYRPTPPHKRLGAAAMQEVVIANLSDFGMAIPASDHAL
jgi:hypothetical protein